MVTKECVDSGEMIPVLDLMNVVRDFNTIDWSLSPIPAPQDVGKAIAKMGFVRQLELVPGPAAITTRRDVWAR
jgi:hypothetical protein